VLWKASGGQWWLLAAGSSDVASIRATGGVRGQVTGRMLAVPTEAGARAELDGHLADGKEIAALR
jgi:hypothetical protein